MLLTGSCGCGAVRYEVSEPFNEMHHCHCATCRKTHGAAFATFAQTAADALTITSGGESVQDFVSSPFATRQFCAKCGGSLFFRAKPFASRVWVAVGTLDGDPGLRAGANAFTASRAPWCEPIQSVPDFESYSPMPAMDK